jgi:hypothetical protein
VFTVCEQKPASNFCFPFLHQVRSVVEACDPWLSIHHGNLCLGVGCADT